MSERPRVLVARQVFPETVERLSQHFELSVNTHDEAWDKAELIRRLQGHQGAFTTGSERIDEEVLAACPELKVVANMAVGYNNFDMAAFDRHGVQATNAPGVLTDTTADFGFALLLSLIHI